MSESSGRDGGRSHGISGSLGIKNTAGHSQQGDSFKSGNTTAQTGSSGFPSMSGNITPSGGRGKIKMASAPWKGSARSSGLSSGTSIGQFPSSGSQNLNGGQVKPPFGRDSNLTAADIGIKIRPENTAGLSVQGRSFKPGDTTGQTGSALLSSKSGNNLPSDGSGTIKTPSTPYKFGHGGRSHGINNTARYNSRGIKNTAGHSQQGGTFKSGNTTAQTGSSRFPSMSGNIVPSDGRGTIKKASAPYEGNVWNSVSKNI